MAGSITDKVVQALAAAIFEPGEVTVVEAYSAFGAELIAFRSPEELVGYVCAQRNSPEQSAHIAIRYRDMGGELLCSPLPLDPHKCQGHTYRYSAAGWGLVWIHLEWRKSPVGSFISANSEKRAIAWAPMHPELGAPEQWNWKAVIRHVRRLRRVLKLVALHH